MDDSPIGVFDSGVGGLTVARAIMDQLPGESITYIGDTANNPYGPRPIAQVRELALEIMDKLVDSGVKMLVIACNSASAAVLHDARERYTASKGIPVVEVIHPAVRAAARVTINNRIGIIGTRATIESGAYEDAFSVVPSITLTAGAAPRFVEFVENGITTGPELHAVAEEYLAPIKEAGVDTLILGCTHYPILAGVISYVMGEDVALVSSAQETARDVYRELTARALLRAPGAPAPTHTFQSTGDAHEFQTLARRFLGPEVASVQQLGGRAS